MRLYFIYGTMESSQSEFSGSTDLEIKGVEVLPNRSPQSVAFFMKRTLLKAIQKKILSKKYWTSFSGYLASSSSWFYYRIFSPKKPNKETELFISKVQEIFDSIRKEIFSGVRD